MEKWSASIQPARYPIASRADVLAGDGCHLVLVRTTYGI